MTKHRIDATTPKTSGNVTHSHLKSISQLDNPTKRAFYEFEAITGMLVFLENWNVKSTLLCVHS